jgi:RimJ/RimL family protein N-acetyltransferase
MHRRDVHTEALALRLRPVEPGDLPALFEIQTDPESNAMAGTKPRSREVFFAAWGRNFVDPGVRGRVIELGGEGRREIVGSISRFQAEGRDCVGYWIARAHWGKGVASRALMMFLREDPRRPLHATTISTNAASQRILVRCGFRCVGRSMGEETERYVAGEISEFILE